ncbi:MAG: hypothetical protein ACON34_03370 [Flavobacteriales bacterium]
MKKLMMLLAMVAFAGALSAQTTTDKKPAETTKTEVKKSCSKSCCSGKTTATAQEGKAGCCTPAATATAEKGRKGRKARRAKGAAGTTTATATAKPAATEPKASTSAVTPVKKTANKK